MLGIRTPPPAWNSPVVFLRFESLKRLVSAGSAATTLCATHQTSSRDFGRYVRVGLLEEIAHAGVHLAAHARVDPPALRGVRQHLIADRVPAKHVVGDLLDLRRADVALLQRLGKPIFIERERARLEAERF